MKSLSGFNKSLWNLKKRLRLRLRILSRGIEPRALNSMLGLTVLDRELSRLEDRFSSSSTSNYLMSIGTVSRLLEVRSSTLRRCKGYKDLMDWTVIWLYDRLSVSRLVKSLAETGGIKLMWLNCRLISEISLKFFSCSSRTLLSERSIIARFWK